MISPCALRQPTALQARRAAQCNAFSRRLLRGTRHNHSVPQLAHGLTFEENGIGEALSPAAFQLAWTANQAHLVDRLNQYTADSATANLTTKELLIRTARQPSQAALFNHASMAHNNHFFFAGLTPAPAAPSPWMQDQIAKAFSSFDTFRVSFIASAAAMFGPGFTWLVARREPMANTMQSHLRILNTYLAGSPYPQAHFRAQSQDVNTSDAAAATAGDTAHVWAAGQVAQGASGVGLHGVRGPGAGFGRSQRGYLAPGGQDLQVLLCLSTWEHVWLPDYGVGGKQAYLERIFDHIDWAKVEGNWSEKPRKPAIGVREAGLYRV